MMAGNAQSWRVAITRDDERTRMELASRGYGVAIVSVLIEGPAPDPRRLSEIARTLEQFDWVMCASVRAVNALREARGTDWPRSIRTAAVGRVTAEAIVAAGGSDPIVGDEHTALGLWETLQDKDDWPGRRVLVTTVADGRRELIDALRSAGAEVTELQAYSMIPSPIDEIRRQWLAANPDAVIVGSASTARRLVEAVGAAALGRLRAVIAIGPTTSAALAEHKIESIMPSHPTYVAAIDCLKDVMP